MFSLSIILNVYLNYIGNIMIIQQSLSCTKLVERSLFFTSDVFPVNMKRMNSHVEVASSPMCLLV